MVFGAEYMPADCVNTSPESSLRSIRSENSNQKYVSVRNAVKSPINAIDIVHPLKKNLSTRLNRDGGGAL